MSTDANLSTSTTAPFVPVVPVLQSGDRLSREEFERRYKAMPVDVKAEFVEGVVYMASPVSFSKHGVPHANVLLWLGSYAAPTTGVEVADNATVRLDRENEPQPDALMRFLPAVGGQTHDDGDFIAGGPEFVCEVASSSANYDLHDKKTAYQRNGVREYLVWRVHDNALDWFILRDGQYAILEPADDGVLKSEVFPGLWLDAQALLAGDMKRVLEVVNSGAASCEHGEFTQKLREQKEAK